MLEAVHIIQQACYNFVMRRRVATLAPYTLSDKEPLSLNLRMQSVRPTLATESSTADEPPLLRETKLREHTSEDEKPQLPFITRRLSAAIAQLRVRLAAASSLGHTDTYTQRKPRSGRLSPRAPSTRATLWPGRCAAARWPRGRARRGGVRAMRSIFLVSRLGCRPETRESGLGCPDDDC